VSAVMATVADHYKTHLAPVYVWMAGGFDAAVSRGETEIQTIFPILSGGITAVDLGAGFGMHSIPLARRGCPVIAIDTSALLLEELKGHAEALPVKAVEDDLLSFQRHLDSKVNLILCMGDTLTHLPDLPSVERLFSQAAESLRSAGIFVITFRNYTTPLLGNDRFIPVKSDADRILTCFLEYEPGASMFTICSMNESLLPGSYGSAPIGSSGSRRSGFPVACKPGDFPYWSSPDSEVWFVLSRQDHNHSLWCQWMKIQEEVSGNAKISN